MCSEKREMTKAEQAVFHIYRRVQECPDFAWLMMGTESLLLCMQAIAQYRGETEAEIRAHINKNCATSRKEPEVLTLRAKVDALESRVARLCGERPYADPITQQHDEYFWQLQEVKDLMRRADIMGETLTVDQLRDAIEGHTRALGAMCH